VKIGTSNLIIRRKLVGVVALQIVLAGFNKASRVFKYKEVKAVFHYIRRREDKRISTMT
jgi:hypothetical protein